MRVLFDTSVLVPALSPAHPHHGAAVRQFERRTDAHVALLLSTHSLAEAYATLSVLPYAPRLTPGDIGQLLASVVTDVFEMVELDSADYAHVLARMAALGLVSGAVYDGLHVRAAEKAGADELVTFNGRDFRRMPPAPPTRLVVLG